MLWRRKTEAERAAPPAWEKPIAALRRDVDALRNEAAHVVLKQWVEGRLTSTQEQAGSVSDGLIELNRQFVELQQALVEMTQKYSAAIQSLQGQIELLAKIKKTKAKVRKRETGARKKTAKVVPLRKKKK